jgi:hypothetical protein
MLGLIRVPLPQPDYHSIRHHHEAGELCPYHDHLLRWHPSASQNDDVAVLHWHWFVPQTEDFGRSSENTNRPYNPVSSPSLHAHLVDFAEPDWDGDPLIRPDLRGRYVHQLVIGLSLSCLATDLLPHVSATSLGGIDRSSIENSSVALRAGLVGLFQRWNC